MNYKMTITGNRKIADNTYEMELAGADLPEMKPGQFINIKLDGFYLRRPLSICNSEGNALTVIYKAVGRGTRAMSNYESGRKLDILLPLGNGYTITKVSAGINAGGKALLIGGGAGVPPMYFLGRTLADLAEAEGGEKPVAILGFNTASEIFYREKFEDAGIETVIATADGSAGIKGFVTDCLDGLEYSSFFACGPEAMLRALDNAIPETVPGQMSFEERMGCGFGACMGCSCRTKYGNKRICKDGPVLDRREIIW